MESYSNFDKNLFNLLNDKYFIHIQQDIDNKLRADLKKAFFHVTEVIHTDTNIFRTSYNEFEIEDFITKQLSDTDSLIYYIFNKAKERLFKLALLEIALINNTQTEGLYTYKKIKEIKSNDEKTKKCLERASNVSKVFDKYIDTISVGNSDLKKNMKKAKKIAFSDYRFPESKPQFLSFITKHHINKSYYDAISKFQDEHKNTFSCSGYISKDIVFLNWSSEKFEYWIPTSFAYYEGFFFDSFKPNTVNNIYKICEDYITQFEKLGKNRSRKFEQIYSKYQNLSNDANTVLSKLKENGTKTSEYLCNEFLINNILRHDFFFSINSDFFYTISKLCRPSILKGYNGFYEVPNSLKNTVFYYELLRYLFIFDINMNKFDETQFSDINMDEYAAIDTTTQLPLQLIYNFLFYVHSDQGTYLSIILSDYTDIAINSHDFNIPIDTSTLYGEISREFGFTDIYSNNIILDNFAYFVSCLTNSMPYDFLDFNIDHKKLDDEQHLLLVHFFHYPSGNGTLF